MKFQISKIENQGCGHGRAYPCNPSMAVVEFKASLSYIVRPCHKRQRRKEGGREKETGK